MRNKKNASGSEGRFIAENNTVIIQSPDSPQAEIEGLGSAKSLVSLLSDGELHSLALG